MKYDRPGAPWNENDGENRMRQTDETELPNPFLFEDGSQVETTGDWERRRNATQPRPFISEVMLRYRRFT